MTPALPQFSQALLAIADPARAPAMRAYMRDQFEFLGIATPLRRAAIGPLLRELRGTPATELLELATRLWQLPQREFQYCAIDLLAAHWKVLQHSDWPALQALALQKSWWDTVDGLAGVLGDVLRFGHEGMDQALRHNNFWIRRIALLHQLGWRGKTDETRLFDYSLALSHENEFFIQKAIGWALRDYARHAPDNVSRFIVENKSRLSPLSFREAAKHLSL